MPAVSKVQQKAMAIALHSPNSLYKKNKGLLSMAKEDLDEFASTKIKGLPTRKKKAKIRNAFRNMSEED